VPLSRNLGALTSQNPVGLFRPDTGLILLSLLPALDTVIMADRIQDTCILCSMNITLTEK